jgi:hypothetical protein
VGPEALGKFKNITSSGIEPATSRFVAYCLNHYATACIMSAYLQDEMLARVLTPRAVTNICRLLATCRPRGRSASAQIRSHIHCMELGVHADSPSTNSICMLECLSEKGWGGVKLHTAGNGGNETLRVCACACVCVCVEWSNLRYITDTQ